jgi:hypothetical protein
MARVLRRVDVVLQNHTQELLAIEGCVSIQGQWNVPGGSPKVGAVVPKQGSDKWSSISTEDGVAAEASVRFGCTKGYVDIHWRLPWAADQFEIDVTVPEGLECRKHVGGPNDDHRVVLVTVTPSARPARR